MKLQTNPCILLILCTAFVSGFVPVRSFASAPINVDAGSYLNKVDVQLVPTEKAYSQNGPVICHLIITNRSSQDLHYYDLPLPKEELFFDEGKAQGPQPTSREIPTPSINSMVFTVTLKARSWLNVPIYLNRHFVFDKPGDYSIPYLFCQEFDNDEKGAMWSGTVRIVVRPVSTAVLTQELAAESRKLVSPDAAIKIQAAEALNYLDTPLVVPYLKAILTMPNAGDFPQVETETVQALNRIGTPETLAVIEDALPNLAGSVAEEAMYELMDKKIVLSKKTIKSLLSSFDSKKRHVAVTYLVKFGNTQDIPLLEPLRKDISLDVEKAVNDGIVILQNTKAAH